VAEFELFRQFIHQHAGIALSPEKKVMVGSRLLSRVNYYNVDSYQQYFQLATHPENTEELLLLVDILTTNETYFFREPKHFEYFNNEILADWKKGHFRVWSAASSSGEEAYSLAMLLAEQSAGKSWDILGTDLNRKVLSKASKGVYFMERLELLESHLMKKYCLKGVRTQQGQFCINSALRNKVNFHRLNLMQNIPQKVGKFDVIFLRNVLIYFDSKTKKEVVERLIHNLKPGGHFFISHSETLTRVTDKLEMIQPSIYIKK